jgi:opacity protein-like surface antigen
MNMKAIPLISMLAAAPGAALAGGHAASVPADPAVVAPPASQSDWTGLYVGAQVGNLSYESFATRAPIAGDRVFEGEGGFAGLHAGYMHDFGTVVLGGEAEVSFSDVDLDFVAGAVPGASTFTVERSTLLKARIGIDAGRILPYAVAGYGWHDVNGSGGAADQAYRGAAFGVGVSFLLSDTVMIGTEILYHDLDAYEADNTTLRAEITTVSLRASWRF